MISSHVRRHLLAADAQRDLLRVQALSEARRRGRARGDDRGVRAARGRTPADACLYVCECGAKFTASTCPHTACPVCGQEQLW
jgi:hypothetical protein